MRLVPTPGVCGIGDPACCLRPFCFAYVFLFCLVSAELTAPDPSGSATEGSSTCDDATLLQTARAPVSTVSTSPSSSPTSTASSSQSTASLLTTSIVSSDFRPPNAEMRATLAGLNFALAQSKAFVAMKIIEAPLIPGHTVTASMM